MKRLARVVAHVALAVFEGQQIACHRVRGPDVQADLLAAIGSGDPGTCLQDMSPDGVHRGSALLRADRRDPARRVGQRCVPTAARGARWPPIRMAHPLLGNAVLTFDQRSRPLRIELMGKRGVPRGRAASRQRSRFLEYHS